MATKGAVGIAVAVLTVMVAASAMEAAVVDVTVTADKSQILVGEKANVTVSAEVRPGTGAASNDGIFAWGIDVTLDDVFLGPGVTSTTDPDVLSIFGTAAIGSAWDGAGSGGTPKSWGLEAIWDTQFNNQTRGFGSQVVLFTVEVEGLAIGIGSVGITGNPIQGADFITHQGANDDSGSFGGAVNIQVVPEPSTLGLLGVGALAVLQRRRRQSQRGVVKATR